MGKYSHLKGTLDTFENPDQAYQEKVNIAKSKYNGDSTTTLTQAWLQLRLKKEQLEDEVKKLNLELEATQQLIISQFEDQGIDKIRLQDGMSVSLKDEPYAGVEDRGKFLSWVKLNKMESLLTVHYQTMSSLVKDRLLKKMPVPPGIKVWMKTSLTRYQPRS